MPLFASVRCACDHSNVGGWGYCRVMLSEFTMCDAILQKLKNWCKSTKLEKSPKVTV